MTRLPQPGKDIGTWGGILNDFLKTAHNPDGSLKSSALRILDGSITTPQLADNAVTDSKLDVATQTTLATVASKYTKPAGGVPLTDLSSSLRANLTKAGTSVQQVNNKTPDGSGALTLTAADVGAATSLGGLSDVNATGATNSQVLSYNTGSSKWTAATVTSTTVSDASNTGKGILQLAGDLAGSNDPTNPTISTGAITDAKVATGAAIQQSKIQNLTTALNAKAPTASPTFSGTVTVPTPANPTDATTKGYVDSQVTTGSTPDASPTTKGKIQLAGDLAGTAASPTVAKLSGVSLAGLTTGLLKNTTGTGVPSIATASDIPDLSATYATATALTTEASTARTAESKAVPRWAPTTTYTLGQQVVSPNNDVVSAIAGFTSEASYVPANWAVSSTYVPMVTGLAGTGATDMQSLIQAALTAAAPGATVRLPGINQTYMIASGLTIPSRVTLDLGGAILQVKNANPVVQAITFSGVTGSRVTNGRLQGNVTNKAAAVNFTSGATDCVVDHCSVDANFQIVVIGLIGSVNCGITDCTLEGGTSEGVEFVDSTNCYADRNHITGLAGTGVVFTQSTAAMNLNCRASHNYITGCTDGILGLGGSRTNIADNTVLNSQHSGIALDYFTSGLPNTDSSVSNNKVDSANLADAGLDGIRIAAGSSGATVKGNTVTNTYGVTGSSGAGIDIIGSYHTVSGNVCRLNATQGIVTQSGTSNIITNNVCLDNSVVGIASRDNITIQTPNTLVAHNVCNDTRGTKRVRYGILLTSVATGSVVMGNISPNSGAASYLGGISDSSASALVANNGLLTTTRPPLTSQPWGVANPTISSGAAITPGGGAAYGSTGTMNDTSWTVGTTTAAGATAGVLFTVTFGEALTTSPKVFLAPWGPILAAANLYVSARSTTGFSVSALNAPTAGYDNVSYWVVQ
jgi:hypothetical protein